jgi:hypothetical protein
MRRVLVLLMVALSIDSARLWAARECLERVPAVTVQIHDYEHLPGERLSRASEIVSQLYEKIGVRIEWFGAMRQNTRDTRSSRSAVEQSGPDGPAAQMTVIILTSKMAARGRIPEGVLGYAAVPAEGGMGRIAYVIYDRVRQVAAGGPASETELLGFVIAHETGHLLLGRGSGTATGLMKCQWDRRNMQQLDALKLGFTELQAVRIRNRLTNGSAPAAVVAAGGARAGDSCGAVPRDEREAVQNAQDRDSSPH